MKAHMSRRYHFSASHRLHTESYDSAKNLEVFGKMQQSAWSWP